jgi:hypothetical protein
LAYAGREGKFDSLKEDDDDDDVDDELKEESRLARLAVLSRPVFSY